MSDPGETLGDPAAAVATGVMCALLDAGVERVVVSPGSRHTPLLLACERLAMKTTVVVDERAAGFVALGAARASGSPVALLCTSGSALANYLPAVVEASASALPLVVVSANRPAHLQESGAPQTMRQPGTLAPHVRAELHVDASRDWATRGSQLLRDVLRTVARALREPTVGPVHIDVGFEKPLEAPLDESWRRPPRMELPCGRFEASDAQIERAAATLAAARRGLVLLGPRDGGGAAASATRSLLELCAALRWPVVAEPLAGVHAHPGLEGLCARPGLWLDALATTPTCLLRVGAPTGAGPIRWLSRVECAEILLSDRDPWPDPDGRTSVPLVGNLESSARRLANAVKALEPETDVAWTRYVSAVASETSDRLDAQVQAESAFTDLHVAGLVWTATQGPATLHVASSSPVRDLDEVASATPNAPDVTSNRGVNGIDGTVATALGHAVASGRRVRCFVGDVAAFHDLDGLAALASLGADVDVVVVDNGGGRIFERLPIADRDDVLERYYLTPPGGDLSAVARGLGVPSCVVESESALTDVLANYAGGPRLVVARTEPAASRALRSNIGNLAADSVAAASDSSEDP